jgi:hypothetical protein
MIVYFYFGYTGRREEIVELNIFNESQLEALDHLGEKLLEFQRVNDDVDYLLYDPAALTEDARWNDIRSMAKNCLKCCNFDSEQYETEVTVAKYPHAVTHQWILKPKTNP